MLKKKPLYEYFKKIIFLEEIIHACWIIVVGHIDNRFNESHLCENELNLCIKMQSFDCWPNTWCFLIKFYAMLSHKFRSMQFFSSSDLWMIDDSEKRDRNWQRVADDSLFQNLPDAYIFRRQINKLDYERVDFFCRSFCCVLLHWNWPQAPSTWNCGQISPWNFAVMLVSM